MRCEVSWTGLRGSMCWETTVEEAKAQFDTNFFGTVRMVRGVLPSMRAHSGGRIVNIGTFAGLIGVPFQRFYSASKHAIE